MRFSGQGQPLRVEEVATPAPGPGQVLVKVAAAGVCGTELHFQDGLLAPATTPITLGHEVAGTVESVGEGVDEVAVGDRVAVHYFHSCGQCDRCTEGDDHLCDAPLGFLAFVNDGGFADYVVVPARSAVPVPDEVELVDAAPLCCSGTTAVHAVRVADVQAGDVAVVYGVGGVGFALVQVLLAAGARVIAVARGEQRLALARALGAETVQAGVQDVAEQVRELTGGRGADVAFELVGTAETGAAALACLGKRGALVYIGYSFDAITISPLSMVVPEQRILTSVGNRRSELVEALALAAAGKLRTQVQTRPLDQASAALDDLRAGDVVGRVVLVP